MLYFGGAGPEVAAAPPGRCPHIFPPAEAPVRTSLRSCVGGMHCRSLLLLGCAWEPAGPQRETSNPRACVPSEYSYAWNVLRWGSIAPGQFSQKMLKEGTEFLPFKNSENAQIMISEKSLNFCQNIHSFGTCSGTKVTC